MVLVTYPPTLFVETSFLYLSIWIAVTYPRLLRWFRLRPPWPFIGEKVLKDLGRGHAISVRKICAMIKK